jgi:hypothetical protein
VHVCRLQFSFQNLNRPNPDVSRIRSSFCAASCTNLLSHGKEFSPAPNGGRAALGAIQNKTVDILTIEYLDAHEGYHGAVFVLPKKQAADIQRRLTASMKPLPKTNAASCEAERTPDSVLVAPIKLTGVELPRNIVFCYTSN